MQDKQSWRRVCIKDVCESIIDCVNKTAPTVEYQTEFKMIRTTNVKSGWIDLSDVKYVTQEVFERWTRRAIPKKGDVILTREAPLGEVGILRTNDKIFLGQRLVQYRANSKYLDNKFLLYAFQENDLQSQIKALGSGATVEHMRVPDAEKLTLRLPPLTMQHTIADILSAYDDLIENNARRIAVLEEMAQMLYDEWFVKFRFPGYERVKMVESELGMIPEGWEVARLGDIAIEIRRSINPESVDPETPYFGLEHLPRKSIALADWGTAKTVQSTKLVFKKGEILFGKIRPYLHKVGIAPLDGVCSSDTIVIGAKQDQYRSLLLNCVSSDHFVAFASKTSQGTQMPRANWDVLATFIIAIPPPELLSLFNDFVESTVDSIINIIFSNRNLRRTRDLLLPKLISGEIDVSSWVGEDAEVAAQELAASVVGTANGYDTIGGIGRKVAEVGPMEPIEKEELEWHSLWE